MKRILAVDDSASMRQMVGFTLKNAGYDVTEAKDGQEALEVAKNKEFDVIISDVNMPNMDGIELVKNLRTLPQFKFTPILIGKPYSFAAATTNFTFSSLPMFPGFILNLSTYFAASKAIL